MEHLWPNDQAPQSLQDKRNTYKETPYIIIDIATTLNSYFSSVGKTLTRNLTSHTKYQCYLKNQHP